MTEQEYIKYLRKNYHLSNAKIKADIEDCQKLAKKNGISPEEMFELVASIDIPKQVGLKVYDNGGNFLKKIPGKE